MTNTNTTERDALMPCPSGHDFARLTKERRNQTQDGNEYPIGWYSINCKFRHDDGSICGWHMGGFPDADAAIKAWNARTANASEASETRAAVATLLRKDPDDERDGFYLSLADLERLAKLPPGTKLYTAPPSDLAAVEGVSEALRQIRLIANNVISGHTFPVNNALRLIIEYIDEAERARTSDTNAAAAPVGQAVDVEAMLRACVPGGDVCDPQLVCDEIREYFANWSSVPPTPRAAYRQPTIEDGDRMRKAYLAAHGDCEECMLAALNSIGAVIAEEVPK